MQIIPKVDELNVSLDDNICKTCSWEVTLGSYHSDTKYDMTENWIISVLS